MNPRKTCAFTRFRGLRTTVHHRPRLSLTSADKRPVSAGERSGTGVSGLEPEPAASPTGSLAGSAAPGSRCRLARLQQRPRLGVGRERLAGQQAEDVGDQGGVGGALPGMTLEQAWGGVQQERRHRAIGFGQVQSALQGVPSGGRAAERAAGDRLQQASLSQPGPPVDGNWAVQDRFARRRRGTRVVLRPPQCCRGDAYLAVFRGLARQARRVPARRARSRRGAPGHAAVPVSRGRRSAAVCNVADLPGMHPPSRTQATYQACAFAARASWARTR